MKNKHFYFALILLFTLICTAVYISTNYYVSTTFKKLNYNSSGVATVSSNQLDLTFQELKNTIKSKYNNKLLTELDVISKNYRSDVTSILGDNYTSLHTKLNLNNQIIETKSNEFLNSNEYLEKKRQMKELKVKMDNSQGEEHDKYYDEFQFTLNEISTLNVKLNNQLKEIRENNDKIRLELKTLFDNNKEQIVKLREEYKNKVSAVILKVINEYNFELYELSDAFGVKLPKIKEFPFDIDKFNFKCVSSPYEAEYFSEPTTESVDSTTKIEFVDVNYKEIN